MVSRYDDEGDEVTNVQNPLCTPTWFKGGSMSLSTLSGAGASPKRWRRKRDRAEEVEGVDEKSLTFSALIDDPDALARVRTTKESVDVDGLVKRTRTKVKQTESTRGWRWRAQVVVMKKT